MIIVSLKPITVITKDEFHKIDERMLGHAFAIHNQYGRLFDEVIYKSELAQRCSRDGMDVQREVRIRVSHREFVKDYFIDLLLCGSTILEVKAATATLKIHHGQGINYLLLAGTNHGSLVNFRPSRVVRRFLSTRLTQEIRRRFVTLETSWPTDEDHSRLRECVIELCRDIGLGLDLASLL
jgi:GxxExxY protein